jgi:hypothetical protein
MGGFVLEPNIGLHDQSLITLSVQISCLATLPSYAQGCPFFDSFPPSLILPQLIRSRLSD